MPLNRVPALRAARLGNVSPNTRLTNSWELPDQLLTSFPSSSTLPHVTPSPQPRQPQPQDTRKRFIIAIDFGTTFSTVGYVLIESNRALHLIAPHEIGCIDHWPNIPGGSAQALAAYENVPSELWYPNITSSDDGCDVWMTDSPPNESHRDLEGAETENDAIFHPSRETTPTATSAVAVDSQKPIFGYGVHKEFQAPDRLGDKETRLARFKLILDETSSKTQYLRNETLKAVNVLKERKLIQDENQIIADYLEQVLAHTKKRLELEHDLQNDSPIEFVLCVPNIWTRKACRRMHEALAKAVRASGLGYSSLADESIKDLFIVSEPEAAAEYVLATQQPNQIVLPGESFLLLDAGGGTVDAITYKIKQTKPLRLDAEKVVPDSALCGSSFLNEAFEALLRKRLHGVQLAHNDFSIHGIIDGLVVKWENGDKREVDVYNSSQRLDSLFIQGLGKDEQKRFKKHRLFLNNDEMKDIFMPRLEGIGNLVKSQLRQAAENGICINKVILIGGFGESPSLKSHLRAVLGVERNLLDCPIEAVFPRITTSAVARGAVLRALRKEDGPTRITRSSFGILRTDLYNEDLPAHQHVKPTIDKADGLSWVRDTIEWVIHKVSVITVEMYPRLMHAVGHGTSCAICNSSHRCAAHFQEKSATPHM